MAVEEEYAVGVQFDFSLEGEVVTPKACKEELVSLWRNSAGFKHLHLEHTVDDAYIGTIEYEHAKLEMKFDATANLRDGMLATLDVIDRKLTKVDAGGIYIDLVEDIPGAADEMLKILRRK